MHKELTVLPRFVPRVSEVAGRLILPIHAGEVSRRVTEIGAISLVFSLIFFFNDTATTEIYTLSLHDALPIYWVLGFITFLIPGAIVTGQLGLMFPGEGSIYVWTSKAFGPFMGFFAGFCAWWPGRSEEHTSELQSLTNLVCRLLLEKKNRKAIH